MTAIATEQATLVPTGTWTIDPAHSSLEFSVRFLGVATVRGRAGVVEGTVVGGDDPRVDGVADAASITTYDADRDVHLASPEFFDAARHPTLRFASTGVRGAGDRIVVEGELTIKGLTRTVELTGTLAGPSPDPWGGERIALELQGTVDRTDFGLRWNAPLPGGGVLLGDEVRLHVGLSAVKDA